MERPIINATLAGVWNDTLPDDVIELQRPFILSILDTPPNADFNIIAPEHWTERDKQAIKQELNHAQVIRDGVMQVLDRDWINWGINALHSKEALMQAGSIRNLRKGKKTMALVVGNGPSVDSFFANIPDLSKVDIFCVWHALPKLEAQGIKPKYICHLDARTPFDMPHYKQYDYEGITFIATAGASSDFISLATRGKKLYHYLNKNNIYDHVFSLEKCLDLDRECINTVATLSINSAIYAGFRTIGLIGVDLNTKQYEEFVPDIEAFPEEFQDIRFLNFSTIGERLRGFTQISLKEIPENDKENSNR